MADGIDICFSSSNKCLHSAAGVALVCVSPRVWPRIAGARPPTYYLDLSRYRRAAAQLGQTPFTPGGVGLLRPGDRPGRAARRRAACPPGGSSTGVATSASAGC